MIAWVLLVGSLAGQVSCFRQKRKPVEQMTREQLLDSLSNEPDEHVRAAVVRQLGRGKDHLALTALTVALKDDSEVVKLAAVSALGDLGDRDAADPLFAAMNDPVQSPALRAAAALALSKVGDGRASQGLVQALPNREAFLALAELGPASIPPLIEAFRDSSTRQNAEPVLIALGPAAIDALTAVLRTDPDKYARLAAVQVLAEIDDLRAAAALDEALKEPGIEIMLASYRYAIRSGNRAYERRLIDTLLTAGRREMALDFVLCGNEALKAAGEAWARREHAALTVRSSDRDAVLWGGVDPRGSRLALFHFDGSLASISGAMPLESKNVSFVPGKWGRALSVDKGGVLKYSLTGNLKLDEGTIEMWIAPKIDGTDPIFGKYNHGLLLYHSTEGDQFLVSANTLGSFYCGSVVKGKFSGAGGGSFAAWKAGTWHHVAFTYSSRNSRQRLYIDGVLISETRGPFPAPDPGAGSFTIGCDPYGNWSGFDVDEVLISNAEKSSTSIQHDAWTANPL